MADPSRLLASAGRIYGDRMAELWGEFLPVPRASLRVVDEGDTVALDGRRFEVAYVPGHARHHVAYYEAATGIAWVGDVGGIRIEGGPVLPVTPPPDIDVERWEVQHGEGDCVGSRADRGDAFRCVWGRGRALCRAEDGAGCVGRVGGGRGWEGGHRTTTQNAPEPSPNGSPPG